MTLDISVIIPQFNAEKTIKNCVQSIVNFLTPYSINYEILILDDCSTDSSLAIAESLAASNSLIRVIPKEKNGGVSHTRNLGIELAKGDYLMFVDSDDVLLTDASVSLNSLIHQNYDLIFFGSPSDLTTTPETLILHQSVVLKPTIGVTVWNKLYRRAYLTENHISFNEQLRMAEDVIFNFDCLSHTPNVTLVSQSIYQYLEPSSVHLYKPSNLKNEQIFQQELDRIEQNHTSGDLSLMRERYAATGFSFLVDRYFVPCILLKELGIFVAARSIRRIYKDQYASLLSSKRIDHTLNKRDRVIKLLANYRLFFIMLLLVVILDRHKSRVS